MIIFHSGYKLSEINPDIAKERLIRINYDTLVTYLYGSRKKKTIISNPVIFIKKLLVDAFVTT